MEIYVEELYPTSRRLRIDQIVDDNVSPHNNDTIIRVSHRVNDTRIVGYSVTAAEKKRIRELIMTQCDGYRCEQDKKTQITK